MELSVISYNVLAADFTHHNACFHGSDGREATWQTQARYAMGRPYGDQRLGKGAAICYGVAVDIDG